MTERRRRGRRRAGACRGDPVLPHHVSVCLIACPLLTSAPPPCSFFFPPRPQEERNYILQMVKKIRASGANVLLIQKSILRDAVTDLSLHYLVRGRAGWAQHGGCLHCCRAAGACALAGAPAAAESR